MPAFRATEISGSLYRTVGGHDYLRAGSNITIDSGSLSANGQIVISSAGGGGGADDAASYVVVAATASLPNERVLTAGSGLNRTDAGAGGAITLAADGTVARISGSAFTGAVSTASTFRALGGITGSHHFLIDGSTSLIAAGTGISVATASNGQITVSNTSGASFVTGSDIMVTNFIQQGPAAKIASTGSIRAGTSWDVIARDPTNTLNIAVITHGKNAQQQTVLGDDSNESSLVLTAATDKEISLEVNLGSPVAKANANGFQVTGTLSLAGARAITPFTGTNEYLSEFIQIGSAISQMPQTGALRLTNAAAIMWANNGGQASGANITTSGVNNTLVISGPAGITLSNSVTCGSTLTATGQIAALVAGSSGAVNTGSLTFSNTAGRKEIYPAKTTTAAGTGIPLRLQGAHAVGTGATKGGDVFIQAGTGSIAGGIRFQLGNGTVGNVMELSPSGSNQQTLLKLTGTLDISQNSHRMRIDQFITSSNAGTVTIATFAMPASSSLDISADVHAFAGTFTNFLIARNYAAFTRSGATDIANVSAEDDTSTKTNGVASAWTTALTSSGANVILTLTTTAPSTQVSAVVEFTEKVWA